MWPAAQRVPSTSLSDSNSPSQTLSNSADFGFSANGSMNTHGQQLPNEAGHNGDSSQQPNRNHPERPSQNGNGGGDDGSEQLDEDLPQIDAKMIPLSLTISRLITYAYTELVTLVDTLPARSETDRRAEILKYTDHMTDLLSKLLALVRWAKHAPQIQKCQNVIAYLDSQNRYFEYAVDSIYATFLSMPNVRMRNYDVGNAVDILTTGSYQRLPVAIKRAVPPPRLTKRQLRETLAAIDGIIRSRILRGERLPVAMRQYTIANGRIVFTVPGEFEAALTLLQFEENIPWHVVNVKVLVAGDKALSDEQQITVNTWQIVDHAQHILIEASNAQDNAAASPSSPQLAQLYDFMHQQCLMVLLEAMLKQAAALRRARWENLLQVEMGAPDRSVLVLRYWTSSRAAATADSPSQEQHSDKSNSIVFRLCALPVPRPIHAPAVSDSKLEDDPEFELLEQDRRNLIPKLGLSIAWTAHAGLLQSKSWSRTVSHAHELIASAADAEASDFDLVLDPTAVNTEQLLRQATWQHARAILKSLHSLLVQSQLFAESAVELLFISASGVSKRECELDASEIQQCTAVPVLRAWYREDEGAVDISVDMFTGRLAVRASDVVAVNTSLSEAMVKQLTNQLNRHPWRVAALLVDMRSSLALADLDCLVYRSLGLRPQISQHEMKSPVLPGFVLPGSVSFADTPAHLSQPQQHQQNSSNVAANFPLRISQQEADGLVREVAGSENPLSRIRFYMIEGTEGVEEQAGSAKGEWYLMVVMTDRLQFRLILLNPHPTDRLLQSVSQIIALQVDRLFSSVARRLLAESKLERDAFSSDSLRGGIRGHSAHASSSVVGSGEREITEQVDAMLTGRTSITLDYLNALASMCRARLALRLLQTQLTQWKIPYSFRLPSFSTSPHGHRAAVSQELSVVELDRMGLYELDEQVPVLYIPISGLMRASPINWHVASQGVLPDEARRMVSVRVASDELDPSLRAEVSSAALNMPYSALSNAGARPLIGRHVIPCQVIASVPVALDRLPGPVSRAFSDAVHFGAHAEADGGYHRKSGDECADHSYSKVVLVYRQVNRALQSLIRDWSEQHLMTHIGRHMYAWEQRTLRRVLASTIAFYPFGSGPYTSAVAATRGALDLGRQPAELVVQCIGSCFVSISCCVPRPFEGTTSGDVTFHLTLADVDPRTNRIERIASTWPWVLASGARDPDLQSRGMGFEISVSLSRWLSRLQDQLNLTGNPLAALSTIVQLMPIHHIIGSISAEPNTRVLVPSLQLGSDPLIRFQIKSLLESGKATKSDLEDQSYVVFQRLSAMTKDISGAFGSVRGLSVMHMYTAVDNIRLVFNSRYVVDLKLVAREMYCIADAVQALAPVRCGGSVAPEPLVTATTEPIPLFAAWLDAMSRAIRFNWARLERGMEAILRDVAPQADSQPNSENPAVDAQTKSHQFQRNLFCLRPDATKAERLFHEIRKSFNRQSSARVPSFLVLPPSAVICSKTHLIPVLRSLMRWLVQSVHVRDQLEMAIARTQEISSEPSALREPLIGVREKLVFMSDRDSDAASAGGSRQVMIVAFTGARESVRCEFLVQASVAHGRSQPEQDSKQTDSAKQPQAADSQNTASNETFTADDETTVQSMMSDMFTIPEDLMHAELDVRIVPLTRPPNGITEAAATHLVESFKQQPANIRQRAGVLVRILALPPQIVMDIVGVQIKLKERASICALNEGVEHLIRLDPANCAISFVLQLRVANAAWTRVAVEYALLTGMARIQWVMDSPSCELALENNGQAAKTLAAVLQPWTDRMDRVIAALDSQTAFTRDMGKAGKSRLFDIISVTQPSLQQELQVRLEKRVRPA
ncbi:mediator complex subunit [Coemansia sp. RSA 1250]|nr:mediator complex subunit [Coemansia sp. RSA 1250]